MKTVIVAIFVVALAAGCSSSSKHNASKHNASKQDATSAGRIVKLTVPAAVACGGRTSTEVPVSYETTGNDQRQVIVDGLAQADPVPAAGSVSPPVHCDGVQHTVALVLTDAHGKTTSEVRYFTTTLG